VDLPDNVVIPRLAKRAEGPPSRRGSHASALPRSTKIELAKTLRAACVSPRATVRSLAVFAARDDPQIKRNLQEKPTV